MKNLKKLLKSTMMVAMAIAMITFAGCKDDDDPQPGTGNDIMDVARATPVLSTLVTAIETAGLSSTLKGDGPFTVFAPTNAAFDNLPDGVLDDLLANPAILAQSTSVSRCCRKSNVS